MGLRRTVVPIMSLLFAAWLPLYAVGLLFHFGVPLVAPSIPPLYGNTAVFRPWAGWTSAYMALHPLGFGVLFVAVHRVLLTRCGIASGWLAGLMYGLGVFAVGSLPLFLLMFAALQVPLEVMVSWMAQNACQYLVAGAVVGWVASWQDAGADLKALAGKGVV